MSSTVTAPVPAPNPKEVKIAGDMTLADHTAILGKIKDTAEKLEGAPADQLKKLLSKISADIVAHTTTMMNAAKKLAQMDDALKQREFLLDKAPEDEIAALKKDVEAELGDDAAPLLKDNLDLLCRAYYERNFAKFRDMAAGEAQMRPSSRYAHETALTMDGVRLSILRGIAQQVERILDHIKLQLCKDKNDDIDTTLRNMFAVLFGLMREPGTPELADPRDYVACVPKYERQVEILNTLAGKRVVLPVGQ